MYWRKFLTLSNYNLLVAVKELRLGEGGDEWNGGDGWNGGIMIS